MTTKIPDEPKDGTIIAYFTRSDGAIPMGALVRIDRYVNLTDMDRWFALDESLEISPQTWEEVCEYARQRLWVIKTLHQSVQVLYSSYEGSDDT